MRIVFVIYYLLYIYTLSVAGLVTIDAEDSSIDYTGTWVVQNGGEYQYSADSGASASVSFKGSAVYWYGAHEFRGGSASVSIDGGDATIVDASSGTTSSDGTTIEALYSKTGLDGTQTHTLLIKYEGEGSTGGIYITLYHIDYDDSVTPTTTTTATVVGSSTGSSTTISDGTSPTIQSDVTSSPKTTQTSTSTSLPNSTSSPSSTSPFASSFTSNFVQSETQKMSSFSTTSNELIPGSLIEQTLTVSGVEIITTYVATSTGSVLSGTDQGGKSKLGIILGAVFGSLFALAMIGCFVLFFHRRNNSRKRVTSQKSEGIVPYINFDGSPVNQNGYSCGLSTTSHSHSYSCSRPSAFHSTSKRALESSDPEANTSDNAVRSLGQPESRTHPPNTNSTGWTPTNDHGRSEVYTPPPEYS